MKLKQLRSMLDDVETFDKPNILLEQYPTPPDIAAEIMHNVASHGDIEGCQVLDLGCGGGILSIAAVLLGADNVTSVDIDSRPLKILQTNIEDYEIENIDLIQADVAVLKDMFREKVFDTVVMNPPFGTRKKGVDLMFVEVAASLCSGNVYSLHKSSTRDHLIRKVEKIGLECEVIAQLRYNIDKIYAFHKSESKDIEVDFIRFTRKQNAK